MVDARRRIGESGIEVFPIGLGAMPLSLPGRPDSTRGAAVIRAAIEAGVDFIDTADCYAIDDGDIGHNERLIRTALEQCANPVLVATKGGLTRPGGRWVENGRPSHLRGACESSLRNLGLETLRLYQFHCPDPRVPLEDSLGELVRLRDEGKIQHLGLSNVDRQEIETARAIAPIVSVQNLCHPLCQRDIRSGLVDYCRQAGIAYIPYSPLGGGRGYRKLAGTRPLCEIADRHGCSVYAAALAWLLSKGDHVLPIPGASRPESILDSARAVGIRLSSDETARIDELG